MFLTKP